MSNRSRRSTRLRYLFVANCALFFCTLVISTVGSIIAFHPNSPTEQVSDEIYQKVETEVHERVNSKYSKLLLQAKQAIQVKDDALEELRGELVAGYVIAKDIEITDSNQGYWLAEPKLMLGVSNLPGGRLQISFADRRELISVGERIDFGYQDCDCFLLLKSSTFGNASFRYACTPAAFDQNLNGGTQVVEARLN